MDLSRVGADVFGEADAAALRVLAVQGRGISGREVARLAGIDPSSIQRALARWTQVGLVKAMSAAHATLYTINRHHVLWEAVEGVLAAPARLEQRIARMVDDRFGQRATLLLFGSVARRDSGVESDVDLALIMSDDGDSAA